MEESYKVFASVYDMMQYDVPYSLWIEKLTEKIKSYNPAARSVLELACGTGTIALGLSQNGFYVEGCDLSEDMLTMAQEKAFAAQKNIKFIMQDMKTLEMRRTYDTVVCMCDGMNYITESEDLAQVFAHVERHLNPGGIFLFDLSTQYKLKEVIGCETFAETFEEGAYIWENQYDEDREILEFWLTLFVKEGDLYDRAEEYHKQRSYDVETLKKLMPNGFEWLEIIDGDDFDDLTDTSQRMCMILRKK